MNKSSGKNFSASISQISLDRTNASMNHPLNCNCLRKCAYYHLSLHDNSNKNACIKINKNSGVALKQMNYDIERGLSSDQIKDKKDKLKMPCGPYSFSKDIIDRMQEYENTMTFNMVPNYHDHGCKTEKTEGPCCQLQIKNFNTYNQKSYKDQSLDLPLNIGQNKSLNFTDDLSSQKSNSSRGTQFESSPSQVRARQD